MNWRQLPPLSALRAFSAFAEAGSIVKAGADLGVSHAAISQQLRVLEDHLGCALLDRSGRRLTLTAEGRQLAMVLRTGFQNLITTVEEITGQRDARPLHISTTPSFASYWLMSRLPTFRAMFPELGIMIDPTPHVVSLGEGGIDVAIRYGEGPWPGVVSELIVRSPIVIVAARSLVGDAPLRTLSELAAFPWLEEFGTSEADSYMGRFGVARDNLVLTQVPGNLLLDGARDGQGIAVTVRVFVERDIAAGRLRVLHTEDNPRAGYNLITPQGVLRPPVKAFAKWLRREVKAENLINPDQS